MPINMARPTTLTRQWGKTSLLNKQCQDNWIPICKRMKLDPYLTLHIKIASKWITDLNVRGTTIKLVEKNTKVSFHDFGLGNGFLYITSKTQMTKGKN